MSSYKRSIKKFWSKAWFGLSIIILFLALVLLVAYGKKIEQAKPVEKSKICLDI